MNRIIVAAVVFIISASAGYTAGYTLGPSKETEAVNFQKNLLASKTRNETRPTQDPRLYTADPYVFSAYSAAREIPKVLDKLFCYCYCATNPKFNHKSLLTCYVDEHATRCGVCLKEAVAAKQLTGEGKKPEEIAKIFADYYLNR
ncbi:MAG: hypothetical protein HY751_11650 [Nitrospinae bacterium]|nr:hypothetical protein [Nitrospinota bacterium]